MLRQLKGGFRTSHYLAVCLIGLLLDFATIFVLIKFETPVLFGVLPLVPFMIYVLPLLTMWVGLRIAMTSDQITDATVAEAKQI